MSCSKPLVEVRHLRTTLRPPPGLGRRVPGSFALQDISFRIERGETVALLGPNGAGKTTLLRLLARVYRPAAGEVRVRGRASAVIGLAPAFSPELTVSEHLRAYAAVSGTTLNLAAALEFTGLARVARRLVRLLSTGERARLAMAPALLDPADLYLVDEALAVCDPEFRATAIAALERRVAAGAALVLAGQDLLTARLLCRRGLLLQNGSLVLDAALDAAIAAFTTAPTEGGVWYGRGPTDAAPLIERVEAPPQFSDSALTIPLRCRLRAPPTPFQVLVAVKRADGAVLYSSRTLFDTAPALDARGGVAVQVGIPAGCVSHGAYRVAVAVADARGIPWAVREDAALLQIAHGVPV